MTISRLTWDETKKTLQPKKHVEIAFEVAAQIFRDPLRLARQDRFEGGEERWQTLGVVYGITMLLVAHTITEDSQESEPVEEIRIISARRATPRERTQYENENR
jgi:uncharacterized DUF497 family protein